MFNYNIFEYMGHITKMYLTKKKMYWYIMHGKIVQLGLKKLDSLCITNI